MRETTDIHELIESRVIDLLVRAVNQIIAARKVAPQESMAFSCQSIDNILGALAIMNHKETRRHGQKFRVFFDSYVKNETFPRDKAKLLGRIMETWSSSRYEKGDKPAITEKQANEANDIAELLLDFAIEQITKKTNLSQSEIFSRVDFVTRSVYSQDVYPWKSEHVPRTVEFKAFEFLEKLKKRCIQKQLYFEGDIGGISGKTRIAYLGIPPVDELTDFEEEVLWMIVYNLRRCFLNFKILRDQNQFRLTTGNEAHDHDLRWMVLFNFLMESLYIALEDDVGIPNLLKLAEKWHEIILQIRIACGVSKLTTRKGKLIVESVGARFALVESKIKEWLEEHPNFDQFGRQERLLEKMGFRRARQTRDQLDDYDIALLAVASPKLLEEYALRPENMIHDFWSDFDGNEYSPEKIKATLKMEKQGIDVYKTQVEKGLSFGHICLGLKDLAYWLSRFDLTDTVKKRLSKWKWLLERLGTKGIKELFKLIEVEKKKLEKERKKHRNGIYSIF